MQLTVNFAHVALTHLMIWTGVAACVTLLVGPTAPYGRYSRGGWGPQLNAKLAWLTQEIPSLLIPLMLMGPGGLCSCLANPTSTRSLLALAFLTHYSYRSLIFPLLLRGGKPTPLSVWFLSFLFCIWNGFLQVVHATSRFYVTCQRTRM